MLMLVTFLLVAFVLVLVAFLSMLFLRGVGLGVTVEGVS